MDDTLAVLRWIFDHPEKGAMFIVLMAGGWRILREILKDVRGIPSDQERTVERLTRENRDLREELTRQRREGNPPPSDPR